MSPDAIRTARALIAAVDAEGYRGWHAGTRLALADLLEEEGDDRAAWVRALPRTPMIELPLSDFRDRLRQLTVAVPRNGAALGVSIVRRVFTATATPQTLLRLVVVSEGQTFSYRPADNPEAAIVGSPLYAGVYLQCDGWVREGLPGPWPQGYPYVEAECFPGRGAVSATITPGYCEHAMRYEARRFFTPDLAALRERHDPWR